MLKLKQASDVRVDLADGAFVVFDPITPMMRRRALRAVREMLAAEGVASSADADVDLLGDIGEKVSRELIRMGARDWGGIGDEDDNPLDLTPPQATRLKTVNDPERPTGSIDLLLADEAIFEQLDAEYVRPDAIRRAEKNALSLSPNGTSAGATPGSNTVDSAAKRKPRGGAKAAPTKRTRSRQTKAKRPGKS